MAARFSLSSDSDSEPSEEVEEGESGSFVTEEERQALSRHTLTLPELRLTGRKQFFSALNKETALSLLFTSYTTGCSRRPASCDSRGHLQRFNGHKDVYYVAECANCSHHHVPASAATSRIRVNSESQATAVFREEELQAYGEDEAGTPTEGAPFRGRSRSAPPALWAAKKYGRQLRRMSDEFDSLLDKGVSGVQVTAPTPV